MAVSAVPCPVIITTGTFGSIAFRRASRSSPEVPGRRTSHRTASGRAAVNAATGNFFAATLATVEQALLRPRHDGAIAFQTAASARLRAALLAGEAADPVLDDLETLYRAHHPAGAET